MATRKKDKANDKRFRVVGIPSGRNVRTFSREVENVMNDLAEKNYSIRILENGKRGIVIIGERSPQPVLPNFLQMMMVPQEPKPLRKENAKTEEVRQLIGRVGTNTIESRRTEVLKNMMEGLAQSIPAAESLQIADDLMKSAYYHDKDDHQGGNDCALSKLYRQSATMLREFAQPRVN